VLLQIRFVPDPKNQKEDSLNHTNNIMNLVRWSTSLVVVIQLLDLNISLAYHLDTGQVTFQNAQVGINLIFVIPTSVQYFWFLDIELRMNIDIFQPCKCMDVGSGGRAPPQIFICGTDIA